MEAVMQVQARISEIQARFLNPVRPGSTRSADWTAAASAAGLGGTSGVAGAGLDLPVSGGSTAESAVVAEASKYLGVPYLWGGTDPAKGLDCSGFTQLVFGNLGIDLPRVSSQQATAGTAVPSLEAARPGDLLFFDYSPERPGIDHVGIYLGNGQMIAAPQPGEKVKIQPAGEPTVIRRVLPPASAQSALSGAMPATAAAALSGPGGATASSLAGVPYADLFARAGNRHGVDPALLAAVASQESGFDPRAVSPAGAQGLMQFMPATARGMGVDPLDPGSAVDGAARYLRDLTKQFGSTPLALAAYNAGPGTVSRYGGIPPYPETQKYVTAVQQKAAAYR